MLNASTTLTCCTLPPHSHATPFHHTHMLHPSNTLTCYTLPPHSHATPFHHTRMLHPSNTLTCYTLPPHSYATPVSLKQSQNRLVYTGYTFLSRTQSRQKKCSLHMLAIGFYNRVKGHLRMIKHWHESIDTKPSHM